MQTELFTDVIPAGVSPAPGLTVSGGPFEAREVDQILQEVPRVLLDSFNDALRAYKQWRDLPAKPAATADLLGDTAIESVKARLYENVAWAFDLYATPAVADFEWVCAQCSEDVEHLRAILSRSLASEIRELARAVFKVYPADGRRIQQRMRGYLDIDLAVH